MLHFTGASSAKPIASYGSDRDTPPHPLVQEIARSMRGAALGIGLGQLPQLDIAGPMLPQGTKIAIACRPSAPTAAIIAAACRVRRAGHEPVVHLCSRSFDGIDEILRLLDRLRAEAQLREILLVGGDMEHARDRQADAITLLGRLVHCDHGLERIGFAAYPSRHDLVDSRVLEDALTTKLAIADDAGVESFVVTQFGFSAAPTIAWLRDFRARGHDTPVRIGLAGPASTRTLRRCAVRYHASTIKHTMCSAGASLARMVGERAPDAQVRELAEREIAANLGPVTLQLFAFGGVVRTAAWMGCVSRGLIRLRFSESGFEPATGRR